MSDSLPPHGLQHDRFRCRSSTPRACSNTSTESMMSSSHLLSPSSPPFNLSQHQGLFQWVISSYQMAKVLEFQLHINPSNEHLALISFRIDWFDIPAVQGTLRSLLQPHSSKLSVLWNSAFCMMQLAHPYMTVGKAIALTRQTFAGTTMSVF